MKHFNMNETNVKSSGSEIHGAVHELGRDEAGRLYSVHMRELMKPLEVDTSAVEALAGARTTWRSFGTCACSGWRTPGRSWGSDHSRTISTAGNPRHRRYHAGAAAGRTRPDDRGHGHPADRGRPQRPRPAGVGDDRLPGDLDDHDADRRQTRRPVRS